jgi:ABC-type transporter Mla subunit MlaD
MSKEAQNVKLAQTANTPPSVIANAARFNKQFLDSQLGGNPTTVSIGKMLTVVSEQDNTIRVLSRILGRDYNEQHLHDMHNSLFGDIATGPSSGREGMHLGNLLTELTTFIHHQNQQIQALIDEIRKYVKQLNDQMKS